MTAIIETEHGRFRIKAGKLGHDVKARAFRKPPTRKMKLIAEVSADTEADAIKALIRQLDETDEFIVGARRVDAVTGINIPLQAEFDEALENISFSDDEAAMLLHHGRAADSGCTDIELAQLLKSASPDGVQKFYTQLSQKILNYIAPLSAKENDGTNTPNFLYRVEHDTAQGLERLCLHAEFRDAIMEHVTWARRINEQRVLA